MFENVAFGSTPNIVDFTKSDKTIQILTDRKNLRDTYESCGYPAAIKEFMSGSFSLPVKNQYGISYNIWNKTIPTDDATTREIMIYEDCMLDKVNQFKELFASGQGSTITDPHQLKNEFSGFRDYLRLRLQVERGLTTPEAVQVVDEKIFGGYEPYRDMMNELDKLSTALLNKDVAYASLLVSQVKTEMRTAHLEFYNWVAPTYGGQLSQGDQVFVRDFFTKNVPENWSIENFLRVGHILLGLKVPKEVMFKFFSTMAVGWSYYKQENLFDDPRAKKFMDDYNNSITGNVVVNNLQYVEDLKAMSLLKKEDPEAFEKLNIDDKVQADIVKLENGALPMPKAENKTVATTQKSNSGLLLLGLGALALVLMNRK